MLEVHVLASGSDGNCTVIEFDDTAIMIDSGLSYAKTHKLMELEGIDESKICALLLTHEHSDHVGGAGPVARKLNVPIFCNPATFDSFNHGKVEYCMTQTMQRFNIGDFNILPLPTMHDAVDPNAYSVNVGGKNILIATDTGVFTFPIRQALEDPDFAIVAANYDIRMLREGPYPEATKKRIESNIGHMGNVDSAKEIKNTAVKENRQIFLGHLSKHNNTPDIARDTVAQITGIKRYKLDCLEFMGDTRTITVSR
ncbi:MAG: MBL fold metallo-hydrolase [archaeon]|nr:MBL fold metallo-hydrolase [archaeon]